MASTVPAPPSLPKKKRKASTCSAGDSSSSSLPAKKRRPTVVGAGACTGGEVAPAPIRAEDAASSPPVLATTKSATVAATASTTSICESRLPSKKRKGSHDSSVQFENDVKGQRRKNSQDSSVTFEDGAKAAPRKGSAGDLSSVSFDNGARPPPPPPRKGSQGDSSASTTAQLRKYCDENSCNLGTRPRKGSNDSTSNSSLLKLDELLALGPEPAPVLEPLPDTVPEAASAADADVPGRVVDGLNEGTTGTTAAALDHLDALCSPPSATPAAPASCASIASTLRVTNDRPSDPLGDAPDAAVAAKRKDSDGCSTVSSGQRLLLEAIMLTSAGGGSGNGQSQTNSGAAEGAGTGAGAAAETAAGAASATTTIPAPRDRLESWGAMSDLSVPQAQQQMQGPSDPAAAAIVLSAFQQGGGSASCGGGSSSNTTNLLENVIASATNAAVIQAAASGVGGDGGSNASSNDARRQQPQPEPQQHPQQDAPGAIPSRICLGRERLNSIASLSEASLGVIGAGLPTVVDGVDVSNAEIQAFVAVAMASVGDQLADLAGAVESAASVVADEINLDAAFEGREDGSVGSAGSTVASPLIGAVSDAAAATTATATRPGRCGSSGSTISAGTAGGRPRSWSTSSGRISVDYDAVAAAVDAAEAATGALDLTSIANMGPPQQAAAEAGNAASSSSSTVTSATRAGAPREKTRHNSRRQLPLKRKRLSSDENASFYSSLPTEKAAACSTRGPATRRRREKAAAAGYVPPAFKGTPNNKKQHGSPKKRSKRKAHSPDPALPSSSHEMATPRVSNRTSGRSSDDPADGGPHLPLVHTSVEAAASKISVKGQANQKWEAMFECLLEFAEERRAEETRHLPEAERDLWIWDGNVPTTYKTKDGRALGRWVNNQRSAKSKGTLRLDREQRLVDAGLKWSVLASNSWNEMLKELRVYIEEQTREGKTWDGNVPTNYQIKSRPDGTFAGEDKNLGRWVNRQRSLYQAGRLRPDRQLALEEIGLKWSMLATTSWESMFETLLRYVEERKRESPDGSTWDGNVPANYRTNEDPPRALGRWINRQRSAYTKNRLKREYVEKLDSVGLRWSVHNKAVKTTTPGTATAAPVSSSPSAFEKSGSCSNGNNNGSIDDQKDNGDDHKVSGDPGGAVVADLVESNGGGTEAARGKLIATAEV